MGCSHFNPKNIYLENIVDNPIDYFLEPMDNKELYNETLYTLKLIENTRDLVKDKLDNLILVTGAYCFKEPSISACIKSILIKIAYDNEEEHWDRSVIKAYNRKPYFEVKGGKISEEGVISASFLVAYLNDLYLQKEKDKFSLLEDRLKKLRGHLKNNEFSAKNALRIEIALNCFVELELIYKQIIQECDEELANLEDNISAGQLTAKLSHSQKKKTLFDIICVSQRDNKGYRSLGNSQRNFYKNKCELKTKIKAELYK
jgi:hypothetical protein